MMLDSASLEPVNPVLDIHFPLADPADLSEFQRGLSEYQQGRWHEDRWRTFRLRFGVYEQRQIGQHMVRAKIPGGRLHFDQARAIAAASRQHTGGDIHVTTRQDVQLYYIPLDRLPDVLGTLSDGGVSTREASGNTFRNITACPLAGICPKERVNAADVAQRLSETWIRDPLVQHMPRKVKTAISGCEHDCGLTRIDDLGFIATRQNGSNGFRVVAGGGLGTHPRNALTVLEFVEEEDLPTAQEALARIHHRYSKRADKNRSRVKFLVDRFGADGFRQKFEEEFLDIKGLDFPGSKASAWEPLEWKEEASNQVKTAPLRGVIEQSDGQYAVVIDIPLGWLGADKFDALTRLAERLGGSGFVLMRDQNIMVRDLPAGSVAAFQDGAAALGLDAGGDKLALRDMVSCPGVSTCALGITASTDLAAELLAERDQFEGLPDVKIRISGCHNSCAQHHLADIGLHGVAKKIDGKHAPHYRLHVGGDDPRGAVDGPVIPAHLAKSAIKALLKAIATNRFDGETIHAWAHRIGKDGIAEILSELPKPADNDGINWHRDTGQRNRFRPPVTSTGECAAGAMVAEYIDDLAIVAWEDIRRAIAAGVPDAARAASVKALSLPAERLLNVAGIETGARTEEILDAVRQQWSHDAALISALEAAEMAQQDLNPTADEAAPALVALKSWHEAANRVVEEINRSVVGYLSRGAAE